MFYKIIKWIREEFLIDDFRKVGLACMIGSLTSLFLKIHPQLTYIMFLYLIGLGFWVFAGMFVMGDLHEIANYIKKRLSKPRKKR